jgi:hypothetical protein
MPTVTLSRYECSADLVPAVCAACGESATDRVPHTFSWRPSLREARGLGDWWTTRTATVRLPLCREHVRQARRKTRFVLITLLPMVALLAVALGLPLGLFAGLAPVQELAVMTGAAVLLFGWAGTLHFFFADLIRPAEISDRTVTLRGFHRRFVAAVEGDQEPDLGPSGRVAESSVGTGGTRQTDVTLTECEYRAGLVPPVCARCGVATERRVPRRVRVLPQGLACLWAIPFLAGLVFCPPLFVLLMLSFGKRVDVRVPMCPEHEDHWAATDRVGRWLVLPIWSLVATGLIVCAVLDPVGRWLYVGGSVLTFLAVLVLEKVLVRDRVVVFSAEGSDVRLRHVHPAFAAAVAELRERHRPERPAPVRRVEDEWDDYDDEALERRGRRSADGWDDEDDYDHRARRD